MYSGNNRTIHNKKNQHGICRLTLHSQYERNDKTHDHTVIFFRLICIRQYSLFTGCNTYGSIAK